MLIIKRKADESITIEPVEGGDPSQTIDELFADGAIEIRLLEVGPNQVKVAIDAPAELKIWRGQRPDKQATGTGSRDNNKNAA